MKLLDPAKSVSQMVLGALKAEDLMTPNPMSIRQGTTVPEAATFLAGRGISAAPVIDDAGRPVGVVSSTDILVHVGQKAMYRVGSSECLAQPKPSTFTQNGNQCETKHPTVCDVMTPGVFWVKPETPAANLVEKMLTLKVRRLFVVDGDSVLIGVISAIDVLDKLRRSNPLAD